MSKRLSETNKVELVETHNLALSLARLQQAPYDRERWKRALYHAILMEGAADFQLRTKLREALGLP